MSKDECNCKPAKQNLVNVGGHIFDISQVVYVGPCNYRNFLDGPSTSYGFTVALRGGYFFHLPSFKMGDTSLREQLLALLPEPWCDIREDDNEEDD